MLVQKVHHVAYRCIDAKETVQWYEKHLDMKFVLAIAEDEVPSTKAADPTCTSSRRRRRQRPGLLRAAQPAADGPRPQHPGLGAASGAEGRLGAHPAGHQGPARSRRHRGHGTDRPPSSSIYFFDPNGHRLELAADTGTPEMMQKLDAVKWEMLEEWSRTKRAPACGLDARRQHEPAGLSAPIERQRPTPTHPPSDIPLTQR
jgi:lactoylglutathione lyase